MIFSMLTKIFGALSFRRKLMLSIIIVFIIMLALSYRMNYTVFYDRFDTLSMSIVERNSEYILSQIDTKVRNSRAITKIYADDKTVFRLLKEKNFNGLFNEFDITFFSNFDINYYFITQAGELIFSAYNSAGLNSKNTENFMNSLLDKSEIADGIKNEFYENIYVNVNEDDLTTSIYYVCAAPVQLTDSSTREKVGRLITVTRIDDVYLYSLLGEVFKVSNSSIKFYDLYPKNLPNPNDKYMVEALNNYYDRNIADRSTIFKIDNEIPSFKRYLIYDKCQNKILIEIEVISTLLINEFSSELRYAIRKFDMLCLVLLILTSILTFVAVNTILKHLKIMSKILIHINTINKVNPDDVKILQHEISEISTRDDYGLLLSEFDKFVTKNRHLYIDDKKTQ